MRSQLLILIITALAAVLFVSCANGTTKEEAPVAENSVEQIREEQSNEVEALVETESEASEQAEEMWDPANYPDPTVESEGALQAGSYDWNHLEYKTFGDFEDFNQVTARIPDFVTDPEKNFIEVSLKLPPQYITENNSIGYNGGFANGAIHAGTLLGYNYEPGYDKSLSFLENGLNMNAFNSTDLVLRGTSYDMKESAENIPGSYIETEKFVRCVYVDFEENNEIIYMTLPKEDTPIIVIFYVSKEATGQDLEIYDKIVESITDVNLVVG